MLKTVLASLLAIGLACGTALAAGTDDSDDSGSSDSSTPASQYDEAVNRIEAGSYNSAVFLLQQIVADDPGNADAWNYLGFAQRNLGKYDEAFAAYNEALLIDPQHDGANEYLGELYLMTGDLSSAEAQLQVLDDSCGMSCSEYTQLKAAIDAYKAEHGS